eukprot:4207126-Lingulodinium_polyedra.AAC.1
MNASGIQTDRGDPVRTGACGQSKADVEDSMSSKQPKDDAGENKMMHGGRAGSWEGLACPTWWLKLGTPSP